MDDDMNMGMDMGANIPDWLTPVAWTYIAISLLSGAYIAAHAVSRHRLSPHDRVVWVASALYLGPFAVALYRRHVRATAGGDADVIADGPENAAVAGLPGGGASAIAHLVGVPLVVASGLTIAGIDLWVMIAVIAVLAIVLLAAYERVATRDTARALTLPAALATAAATVLAFDVGMGGWMLLLHFNDFMPPASDGAFWFLMQVGVVLGLLTGYPVVRFLARRASAAVPA